jgi:hypothetical protein
MSFSKSMNKLLYNKYFYYFVVILAALNIIGYLTMKQYKSACFFILLAIICYQFTRNKTIILLISLITTNLFMSAKYIREGFKEGLTNKENADTNEEVDSDDGNNSESDDEYDGVKEKLTNIDPELNNALSSLESKVKSSNEPSEKDSSRVDNFKNVEKAYDNLSEHLGPEGLAGVNRLTQNLMQNQDGLKNAMEGMKPLIEMTNNMLESLDVSKIKKMGTIMNTLKGINPLN